MIDTILAWLATYLIHSTVLILGVWGFTRWCILDSLTRSLLWKLALVGGLFTATLQTGFGVQPALGTFALAEAPAPVVTPQPVVLAEEIEEEIEEDVERSVSELVVLEIDGHGQSVTIVSMVDAGPAWAPEPMIAPVMPPAPTVAAAPVEPAAPAEEPSGVPAVLLGLFLGGAALGLGRVVLTARRLQRLLQGRGDITRGPLAERLAALLTRARIARQMVRLTMSPALVSPIALASREIVVPEAALELEGRQQEAMLAHELAHVVRNDPAWLVLAAVIEATLFVQPLNRLARAGMQTAAEELADDWAVRHLGTGLHLARCLTEVAEWQGRGRVPGAFVSPMASGDRSALVHRVQRLLADGGPERGRWTGLRRGLLGVGLIAAVAWGAPGMAVAQPSPASLPEAPDVVAVSGVPEVLPVLALADSGVPVVAVADATAEPEATTLRERRILRRAARLERKAAKAGAKAARLRGEGGGAQTHVVVAPGTVHIADADGGRVVILRDEDDDDDHEHDPHVAHVDDDDDDDDDDSCEDDAAVVRVHPGHGKHWKHGAWPPGQVRVQRIDAERLRRQALAGRLSEAEIEAIRAQARAAARAGQVGRAEAERMREQAREVAREARRGHHPSQAEIEALQREAEALARQAPHFSPEALERMQRQAEQMQRQAERLAERAPQMSEERLRRLERDLEEQVRRSMPDPEEIEAQVRRSMPDPEEIAEQVRRSLPDPQAIEEAVRRAVASSGLSAPEKQRIEAELQRELGNLRALRGKADKDRAKADKEREKADKEREKADREREKAERKADKDREKAERKADKRKQ